MSDLTEAQMDEYREASSHHEIPSTEGFVLERDDKGRVLAKHMPDRDIAEETLILLRGFGDALEAVGKNPMLKAMMPKFGK